MKTVKVTKYAFLLIGVAMLAGAGYLWQSTRAFLAQASTAEGVVVELVPSRSSSSTTWRPVVRFTGPGGQPIEFSSSVSSNPPGYEQGERVEVLYLPDQPRNAKIRGYFSLWGAATIVGGLGALFFLVGAGIALAGALKRRKEEDLRLNGTRIETTFQRVEQNPALKINGRHPFRIVSQWLNPATSEVHVFESGNLWFDPTTYIREQHITVFIERGNPGRYQVDVSFLPKLAK